MSKKRPNGQILANFVLKTGLAGFYCAAITSLSMNGNVNKEQRGQQFRKHFGWFELARGSS